MNPIFNQPVSNAEKANLASIARVSKEKGWITSNLKVEKSSFFGRFFWGIFKNFAWSRKLFYDVDLESSRAKLITLQNRIKVMHAGDNDLKQLYLLAVNKFNQIAPRHTVAIDPSIIPAGANPPGAPLTPPKPKKPATFAMLEKAKAADAKLASGEIKADELLLEAVKNSDPEIAARALDKGADIASLDAIKAPTIDEKEIIDWLKKRKNQPALTPKNIDYFAIDMGLGYKSANLKILDGSATEISKTLKDATVKVPPFFPISNFEMQHYLFKALPHLEKRWKDFLNTFDENLKKEFMDPTKDPSKVPLKISIAGQAIIAEIQVEIIDHFSTKAYFTPQISEWLEKEKPEFIIVRSTGKEDSDTNSNAGGNDSIPFIKPKAEEITEAMGKVIASYFGEKSVGQRLMAGDTSLFNEKERPFIPVVLQVMVGENVGGVGSKNEDVPRSGVLFTRQDDKAKGVTLINTGVGNNEGVVTSRVAVDSYYVDSEHNIHSVVRKKETRFVSVQENGQYKAEAIMNQDPTLVKGKALSDGLIKDLKRIADAVSAKYAKTSGEAKPMDMEYTVKLKDKSAVKPVIYLLQARPLLSCTGKNHVPKSFLDLKAVQNVQADQAITPTVLLDGNAWVRQVEKPEDVLFTDDITKALEEYSRDPKSENIKAIIIKKNAPATSHEAVVLRPKGVAVLVVEDAKQYEMIKRMVYGASEEAPMVIDPQRGLALAPNTIADLKAAIKPGLISYPIPLEMSLPFKGMLFDSKGIAHPNVLKAKLELLNRKYTQLMIDLRQSKGGKTLKPLLPLASKEKKDGYTIRGLFDLMASSETEEAKLALATLLHLLQKRLKKSLKDTHKFRADINIPMFHAFETIVAMSKKELIPAFEKHKPQTLERLYPIKFLDAVVSQQPNGHIVGGFSYATALRSNRNELKNYEQALGQGIKITSAKDLPVLQLIGLKAWSLQPEVGTSWNEFCKELAKDNTLVAKAVQLTERMNKIGMGPCWMNLSFKQAYAQSGKNAKKTLERLAGEFQANENHFKELENAYTALNAYQQQHVQQTWCDPAFAKKNIAKLIKTYQDQFGFSRTGAKSIQARYNAMNSLGRLSLLTFVNQAIETYDTVIKDIKGSTAYPDDKAKAKDIAEVLSGYFQMMEAVFSLPTAEEAASLMAIKGGYNSLTFQQYIEKLNHGNNYRFGFHQQFQSKGFDAILNEARTDKLIDAAGLLNARSFFNVNALMVGSKVDMNFSAHWPNTLEEYFTTFHQNMQKIVKTLSTKCGMNNDLLFGEAKICSTSIGNTFGQQISSLSLEEGKVHVDFAIPLRQHSGLISLRYEPSNPSKGFDLHIELYGNDETDRWDQSAAFGALLAHVNGLSFTKGLLPKIDYASQVRTGAAFSIHVPEKFAELDGLIKDLHYMMTEMAVDAKGLLDPGTYPVQGHKCYIRGLMKQLENRRKVNWKTIDENFYASQFYLNAAIMDDFAHVKDFATVAKIAKNSLLGLARQGLDDYNREVTPKKLQGLLGAAEYNYVPNNNMYQVNCGLKTAAILHLIQALKENEDARGVAYQLLTDPLLKQKMPGAIAALKKALDSFKPLEQRFKESLDTLDFVECYSLAIANNKQEWINKDIRAKIAALAKSPAVLKKIAKDYKELYIKGYEENNLKLLFGDSLQLDAKDIADLEEIKSSKNRAVHLAQLPVYINTLQTQYNNFDLNYKALMSASTGALIGLSQAPMFDQSNGQFYGLDGLLGNAAYSYVFDNRYPDTSKARKAAPLFIIKGFHSGNEAIKQEAFNCLSKLAIDYRIAGKNSMHKDGIEKALFAICRSYYDSMANKGEAAKQLCLMFNKEADTVQKLSMDPYNIEKGMLTAAL